MSFEQTISKIQRVINYIVERAGLTFTNSEIDTHTHNISINYIRVITNRLFKRGLIEKNKVGRVNIMNLAEPRFREFLFTIRILDTNKSGKKHKWNPAQDLEATVKGVSPSNKTAEQIKKMMNEKLFEITRDILDAQGILTRFKKDGSTAVDDNDIIWEVANRGITGVELGEKVRNYDPNYNYEVVYRNVEGIRYDAKNGFKKKDQTSLVDWF